MMAGAGPYCPLCRNAGAEFRADPDGFDIHDHFVRCRLKFGRVPAYRVISSAYGFLVPGPVGMGDGSVAGGE